MRRSTCKGSCFWSGPSYWCAPAGSPTPEHSSTSSPLTPSATSWSAPFTADRRQMSEDPPGFMPAARSWRSSGATRPFSRAFGTFAVARVRVGTTPSHSGLCARPGQLPNAGCSDDDRVAYRAHRDVGTDERVYDHRLADAVGGRPAHVAIR